MIQHLGYFGITAICVMGDQWVKYYMRTTLSEWGTPHPILDIFGLHFDFNLAFNKGVGFSLLSSHSQTPLILLSTLLIVILFLWLRRTSGGLIAGGLSVLLGGAIGNVIDRFLHGGVVDFLHFYLQTGSRTYGFPIFNVADVLITIGVMCILWDDIFAKSTKKR